MSRIRCEECGHVFTAAECPNCGWRPAPAWVTDGAPAAPARCPSDGGALDAKGYCRLGGGFSPSATRLDACPHCRQRLGWAGECGTCRGSATPGARWTWTFPGARYELVRGHWILADPTPNRPVTLPEQNQDGARMLAAPLRAPAPPGEANDARAISAQRWAAEVRAEAGQ